MTNVGGKLPALLIESCVQLKPSLAMPGWVVCSHTFSLVAGGGSLGPPALPQPAAPSPAAKERTMPATEKRGSWVPRGSGGRGFFFSSSAGLSPAGGFFWPGWLCLPIAHARTHAAARGERTQSKSRRFTWFVAAHGNRRGAR